VQEHGRLAFRISAQFPIDLMTVAHIEMAGPIGLDFRVKRTKLRH
jgi:hypothetical protein